MDHNSYNPEFNVTWSGQEKILANKTKRVGDGSCREIIQKVGIPTFLWVAQGA